MEHSKKKKKRKKTSKAKLKETTMTCLQTLCLEQRGTGDGAAQNKRFLCWLSHCKVQQLSPAGDVSQTSLPIQDCKFPS